MAKKKDQLTFEQAFEQLGETLDKLEQGDLPLAEAIALYEKGMQLAEHCNAYLDNAELRVKQLGADGNLIDDTE